MTAATSGPGPDLFSILSIDSAHRKPEPFLFSLLGQTAVLAMIIYFTSCVVRTPPTVIPRMPTLSELPLIFSGHNGGGGGGIDPLPASRGNLPRASLDPQIVPPTVMQPTEMPRLAVDETVVIAPDVQYPQGGQTGDPNSPFTKWLSNGPGGPGGIGPGCCDGVGDSTGPHVGSGPTGIYPAGRGGVSVPQVIYNPEPSFSEEARKSKTQGIVLLIIVVGKDGRPYDIRVRQSLGMGLDEKAMEAVSRWRFRPATLNGQPVATQIAVEVNFRLY
ncbi:MAG TPA: energy transducer TonB [Candidatus Sulfotelmatobacter sp.]|nr:energy transducer TonB [Candidatus Sulfotelmatobacter sp.]